MKQLVSMLVMVAFVGAGLAMAADKPKKNGEAAPVPVKGVITKVTDKDLTYKTTVEGKDVEKTVKPGEKTVITLDGNTVKLADLKPNMPVSVTMKNDKVLKIEATSVAATLPAVSPAPAK